MIAEDTAPGTKVVCAEAAVPDRYGPTPLRVDGVYTVDKMWRTECGAIGVRLVETADWHVWHNASFLRARFRLEEPARATGRRVSLRLSGDGSPASSAARSRSPRSHGCGGERGGRSCRFFSRGASPTARRRMRGAAAPGERSGRVFGFPASGEARHDHPSLAADRRECGFALGLHGVSLASECAEHDAFGVGG